MSLYLPEDMRWLGWIAGAEWPDGDEDKVWAVSDVWEKYSAELKTLVGAIEQAKQEAIAAYPEGEARDEIAARYDELIAGEKSLAALAQNMADTSVTVFDFGTEVQAAKINIIITLCWLAVEIALAWLFPPTAPAQQAAAIGTTRAIMQAVSNALNRSVARLASKLGAPTVQRSFWRDLASGNPTMPTATGSPRRTARGEPADHRQGNLPLPHRGRKYSRNVHTYRQLGPITAAARRNLAGGRPLAGLTGGGPGIVARKWQRVRLRATRYSARGPTMRTVTRPRSPIPSEPHHDEFVPAGGAALARLDRGGTVARR